METDAFERVRSLHALQRPSMLDRNVIITVRPAEIGEIQVVIHKGGKVNALMDVLVQDRRKDELELPGVVGNESVDTLVRAFKESRELEIKAQVVQQDMHYALKFLEATPIGSVAQLIGVQDEEKRKADATIDEVLARDGNLIDHLLSSVCAILGVCNLECMSLLRKTLLGVVLESVAHGMVNGTPGRVNIVLVGPPGIGKGVVGRAAAILNPVHERLSSNTITPAGLVGFSERRSGNRTRVFPGKLAMAHWGVAIIEDLQHIDTFSHRHTYGLFCDMMEMGRLIRTTHRDIDIPVETALLADINPKTTFDPGHMDREVVLLKDLDMPLNFLSRVDLVYVFPRDVERQIKTMRGIVASVERVGPEGQLEDDPRVRDLRVLVALLRDMCQTVTVSSVTHRVNEKLDELLEQNKEKLEALKLTGDFLLRGAKSVLKLVACSARLHGRCEAEEVDVQIAFDLFEEKIRFLSMIEPALEPMDGWRNSTKAVKHRMDRIQEHFAGKTVDLVTLAKMFDVVSRKTLTRDLRGLGAIPLGDGRWRVPAVSAAG